MEIGVAVLLFRVAWIETAAEFASILETQSLCYWTASSNCNLSDSTLLSLLQLIPIFPIETFSNCSLLSLLQLIPIFAIVTDFDCTLLSLLQLIPIF